MSEETDTIPTEPAEQLTALDAGQLDYRAIQHTLKQHGLSAQGASAELAERLRAHLLTLTTSAAASDAGKPEEQALPTTEDKTADPELGEPTPVMPPASTTMESETQPEALIADPETVPVDTVEVPAGLQEALNHYEITDDVRQWITEKVEAGFTVVQLKGNRRVFYRQPYNGGGKRAAQMAHGANIELFWNDLFTAAT